MFSRWMWRCRSRSIGEFIVEGTEGIAGVGRGSVIGGDASHLDQGIASGIVLVEHHTNRVVYAAAVRLVRADHEEQDSLFLEEMGVELGFHRCVAGG